MVIALVTISTIGALFLAVCFGEFNLLPQILAVVTLGLIAGTAVFLILVKPQYLAHPITVLFGGCIYFFLLDAAVQREVKDFTPDVLLEAEVATSIFLVVLLSVWYFCRIKRSPLDYILGTHDLALTGNECFWGAIIAFTLEVFRRLCFAHFNLSDFVRDMMLARSGGSFRHLNYEGDWTALLMPIQQLFLLTPFLADRALALGRMSFLKRVVLALVVIGQLLTWVLDGNRGFLVQSLSLPVFARAATHDAGMRKWLLPLILLTFLLAPTMDLIVQVRARGWATYTGNEQLSWNLVGAHRDDNFYWMVVDIDYAHNHGGFWSYSGFSGFVRGFGKDAFLWLTSPIPRALWPNKPSIYDTMVLTRPIWVSNGIVGALFSDGGILLVIFGGIIVGLWVSSLEPLFFRPNKREAATLTYSLLMLVTLCIIRAPNPWVTMYYITPLFLVALAAKFLHRRNDDHDLADCGHTSISRLRHVD